MKLIDRTGERYGRLVVLERADDYVSPQGKHIVRWLCRCDCGKEAVISANDLRNGHAQSCGCLQAESRAKRRFKHGASVEGSESHHLYTTWSSMKQRCANANDKRYGGRGILVCPEWEDFEAFSQWALSHGYKHSLTIDRVDNDGDYAPDNCRFVDRATQNNNKSNNRFVECNGQRFTIAQWSRLSGTPQSTIINRLNAGRDPQTAIFAKSCR